MLIDGTLPLCSVLNCLCPVGHASKVITVAQVTPIKRCCTWRSFLSTWSTPHKLSLGTMGWHPPHMSKLLKPSLSQLVHHWKFPSFLQDGTCPVRILPHKVTPRMSWRHPIWNIFDQLPQVVISHIPCFGTIQ